MEPMTDLHRTVRDALTNLHTRGFAMERMEEELARAKRRSSNLCAVLIDLAGIEAINTKYGYPTGDAAIRTAAHALKSVCRISDIVCRCQGDQFLVVYVDVDTTAIRPMARRAREQIESRVLPVPGGAIGLKTFAGIACSDGAGDVDALIAAAQADLQRDKRERKSQPT